MRRNDRSPRTGIPILVLAAALAGSGLLSATARVAGGPQESPPSPAALENPPAPVAGREHEILARQVGVWDARVERTRGIGKSTERSKAVETASLCCGGLFLLTDLDGGDRSEPIRLHRILGYDPGRRKYTLVRIDARRTTIATGEGDYDAGGETLSFQVSEPDGKGGTTRHREVFAWKGRDEGTLTIHEPGPEGHDGVALSIRYRRRR